MKKSSLFLAMGMALAIASPAFAQTATETQRDVNQQERIQQGVNSGELTQHEAGKLENGEARIDHAEAKASADGVVTPHEQAKIAKMQNKESRKIYHKKHNAAVTAPAAAQ